VEEVKTKWAINKRFSRSEASVVGQAPEAPHYARVMFNRRQLSSHLANHRFRLEAKLTIAPLIAGDFCAIFVLNSQQVISFALTAT
jgi:hypothetical protein